MPGGAFDLEPPTDGGDAVAEPAQAGPSRAGGAADPVVADLHDQVASARAHRDADPAGFGVLQGARSDPVKAALWAKDQKPGCYTMTDVLGLE